MIIKFLEVRDNMTCIPVMAIEMTPLERGDRLCDDLISAKYLRYEGFDLRGGMILLIRLSDQKATVEPFFWPKVNGDRRTMPLAHKYIVEHWQELENGDVVDVRVQAGERETPVDPHICTGRREI